MTLNELIPAIRSLSHAEKFQLVQIVLQQLDIENGVNIPPPTTFDPRQFFGVAHQSKQAIDDYLANSREGWL